ncbi:hypothetical protein RJT34_31524 [Clitoria ternatea]|uniref:Uncharacterized protein n=1 Tax=Clitoria ternatea TaxID=43366 RepID=A0AAN9EYN8_CLITE
MKNILYHISHTSIDLIFKQVNNVASCLFNHLHLISQFHVCDLEAPSNAKFDNFTRNLFLANMAENALVDRSRNKKLAIELPKKDHNTACIESLFELHTNMLFN